MSDESGKSVAKAAKRPRVDARRATMVDVQIGRNVRKRRIELGLSQTELAQACGVTFQQVQKYENGFNRVSASRLWQFSAVLGMELNDFFAGVGKPSARSKQPLRDARARSVDGESAKVARLVASIADVKLRKRIRTMLAAMAVGRE